MAQTPNETERELVVRCQLRDAGAFAALIGLYHNRLLYYVRRLVENEEVANDVMQEVWMAVWKGIGRLKTPDLAGVWLYRIARNQSAEFWRQRWKDAQVTEALSENAVEAETGVESMVDDMPQLHACLVKLPLPQREALTLFYLEDMSYEEIAAISGCSVGTVRSRLHYGKTRLKELMEETTV